MSLPVIAELNRRRVFRALVVYGVIAFAVLQIVEPVMHGLHWPDAVLSYIVVLLAFGFPVVVGLAWVFDVRTTGIERTAPGTGSLHGAPLVLLLLGIGVLVATPGLLWNFFVRRPPESRLDRSIAVLPLMSAGDENGYFAQGIHDELLRQLSGIGDLQVISRTSVQQYRDGTRNLREIGEALGVASIVEGSIQRVGGRVRVQMKLIDARTDRQLWAERYDRDATDVLAIETAVAEEIVDALHARLSPAQKEQIRRKPTLDAAAYDDYLRGLEYFNRPEWQPNDLAIAASFFRKAFEADSSFALARARFAWAVLLRYWFVRDVPADVIETAREQAEQSLQLEPGLPDGHLALGYYHYYGHRDYDAALKQFEVARHANPAIGDAPMAYIYRRQGKFEEAVLALRRVARLDPRSARILWDLAETLTLLRKYGEAEREVDRALAIAPDLKKASVLKAVVRAAWKGETDPGKSVLRQISGKEGPLGQVCLWMAILLDTNPREALALADSLDADSLVCQTTVQPRAFLRAVAHDSQGERSLASSEYAAAVPALVAEVARQPGNGHQRALLARAYAALGWKKKALEEAERAVESLSIAKDAFFGPLVAVDRARAEARVGESDAALAHIQELLGIPCMLSPAVLRIDPTWGALRDDPRFRRLAGM